jgi:hypothetical protein
MVKYLLLYRGGSGMAPTEEERAVVTAEWDNWFGRLGDDLVDGGDQIGASRVVDANGNRDSAGEANAPVSGYSIIAAGDLDTAVKIASMSPVAAVGGIVEVHEVVATM